MAAAFNLTAQINLRGPTNTRAIASSIRKQLSNIKVKVDLDLKGSSTKSIAIVNKGLQNISTNAARANTNINKLSSSIQTLAASLGSLGTAGPQTLTATSKAASNAGKSVSVASSQMQEFGKQSGLAIRRFAAFSTVTGVIYTLTNAINSAFKEFIQFDKEIVRLSQVTGNSIASLSGITKEITRLSTTLGVTSSDLLEVSVTLAQAGLSAQDTTTALEALAKSALAPSFDNLNSTVEGSIALMRQFSISTSELEGALGSINAVAAAFAVEAGDIIKAIQRTGGVFASASNGVSQGTDALNEFIALFTSVRATTRESAETIATGLRTIFTRIQRGGTIEALKEYGIVLTDLEGKFVGPYEAIRRLSEGLESLDPRDLRFAKIVEELGGFRQIGKVIPLIQQFSTAQDALGVAQRGQSSLSKNAVEAQKSLAVQFEKTRQSFVALIRDIGNSSTFRTIATISLTTANSFISLASALKPLLPMLTALAAIKGASILSEFSSGFLGGLGRGGGGAGANMPKPSGGGGGGSRSGSRSSGGASSKTVAANTQAISSNTSQLSTVNTTLSGMILSLNNLSQVINNMSSGTTGPKTASTGGRILGFAKGGSVPGTGRGDKVPAMLEPGEFVINRSAVQAYGKGKLVKINQSGKSDKQQLVQIPASPNTEFTHLDTRLEQSDFPPAFQKYLKKTKQTSKVRALYSSMGLDLPQSWNQDWRVPSNSAGTFSNNLSDYISSNNVFKTLLGNKNDSSASRRYGFEDRSESIAYSILMDAQEGIKQNLAQLVNSNSKKFYDTDGDDVSTTLPSLLSRSINKVLPKTKSSQLMNALQTKIAYDSPGGRRRTTGEMRTAFSKSKKSSGGLIQKFAEGDTATIDLDTLSQYGTIGELAKKKLQQEQETSLEGSLLKTIEEQIIALGRVAGISKLVGQNSKYGQLTKVMRIDAIRQGRTSLLAASDILNSALKAQGTSDAAEATRISKLTKVAVAGLIPIGYNKNFEWELDNNTSVYAHARGLSDRYKDAVTQMQMETSTAASRFAENMQYSDIFGGGEPLVFDFDETLVSGADILGPDGKPDIPKYADKDIVRENLQKGRLTRLGLKLKDLIGSNPDFIKNTRILTARPQSTADLLASTLQRLGLPYKAGDITGVGQDPGSTGAKKAANISAVEKLIDDSLDNISAVGSAGKKGFLYTQPDPQKDLDEIIGQGNIEGAVIEKTLALLGANLPPIEQLEANRAVDFPQGLGRAAQFFGVDPNIPTEVKRTLDSSSFEKARQEFNRYFNEKLENVQSFNVGGEAKDRSTKNRRRGAYGKRGFVPLSSREYEAFAEKAYAEAGPYGSSNWGQSSGVPMPKVLADYADKIKNYVFETGGAGMSLGTKLVKIPDDIETDALEALKPDLIQKPDGWYAEIEEIAPFLQGSRTNPAAIAKEARTVAALTAEKRNQAYTQAEEAIGIFKKTGQLSLDPSIDSHIRNSFPTYISDLEEELKSTKDPDEQNSIKRKLSKAQKAWPDYQSLMSNTGAIPNQGRITGLSESLYALLDQYGSGDISSNEIDNIVKALGSKLPDRKSYGGRITKLAGGGQLKLEDVKKQISQQYPEYTFRINPKSSGFGYRMLVRPSAKDTPDSLMAFDLINKLSDAPNVAEKLITQIQEQQSSKRLAVGGIANLSGGGSTVKAMVSNGEAFVPPSVAKRIGYSTLDKMNQADRNGLSGFAKGSMGGISVFRGAGSGTSDSIGPIDLPVGSYVVRAAATKTLGLSRGGSVGSVRSFATGGSVDDDRLDYLNKIADKLGISVQEYERSIREQIFKRAGSTASGKKTAQSDIQDILIKNLQNIQDADVEQATRSGLTELFRKIDPKIDDTKLAQSIEEIIDGMNKGFSVAELKNVSDGLRNVLEQDITILSELGDAHSELEKEIGFLTGKMRVRGIDVRAQQSLKSGKFGALEKTNLRQSQRNLESPLGKILDKFGQANQTSNLPGIKTLSKALPGVADKIVSMGDKVGGITGIIGLGATQLSAQMPKILNVLDAFAGTVSETSPALAGLQGALQQAGSFGLSGAIVGKQAFGNKGGAVGGAIGLAGGALAGFITESTAKETEMAMKGVSAATSNLSKTLDRLSNARTLQERSELQDQATQNYQALNSALEQSAKTIRENRIWKAVSGGLESFVSTLTTVIGMMAASRIAVGPGGAGSGRRQRRSRPRMATGGMVPVKLASGEGVFYPPLPASKGQLSRMNQADKNGYRPSFGGAMSIVPGSGSGKIDTFDTMLPEGSYVIRTDAMNAMMEDQTFTAAKGGSISGNNLSVSSRVPRLASGGDVQRLAGGGLVGMIIAGLRSLGPQLGIAIGAAVSSAIYSAVSQFFDTSDNKALLEAEVASLEQLRRIADNSEAFATGNKTFAQRLLTLSEPIEKAAMTDEQRRAAYGRSTDATGGLNPLNILQEQEARGALGAEGMIVNDQQTVQEYLDTLGTGTEQRKKADAAIIKAQERLRKRIYLEARQKQGADITTAEKEFRSGSFDAQGRGTNEAGRKIQNLVEQEQGREIRSDVLAKRLEILNRSVKKFTLSITDVMNRLSSNMTRIVSEIDASATRATNISGEFFGGGARANETDSENLRVLENITAYSRDELGKVIDSVSAGLGGTEQATQMGEFIKGLQVIQQELPLILRDTAGGDIGEGAESNVKSRLSKMFGGLNMSPEIQNQLEDSVMEWIRASTTMNRQGMTMEDLAGDVGAFKELSDAAEKARQTFEEYARKQVEVNRKLGAMSDQLAASFDKLADNAIRVQDINLQSALQLKEKFGQTISLRELNAPFESNIRGLTGGITDPAAIGREISNAIAQKRALESDPGRATGALGSGEIAKLTSKINRYQRALDLLATSTDRASAALKKIDEQAQISAGRRRSVMDFFSMLDNPEAMFNFVKESNSYGRVMGGAGGLGDIQGAISTLQSLEGTKTPEEFADLQRQLFENITRILENSGADPAIIDRLRDSFAKDFGKPQDNPQIKPYIDAFQKAADIQTAAVKTQSNLISEGGKLLTDALSLAATDFTTKMSTAINNIVAQLNGVANRLGLGGAAPAAPGFAGGGLIGYYSMGDLVNFTPKGTDTVPAMLTRGEFVVNRAATSKHLPLLQSINSGTYSSGGKVAYLQNGGLLDRSVRSRFPIIPESGWSSIAGQAQDVPLSGLSASDLFRYIDYRKDKNNIVEKYEFDDYNLAVDKHFRDYLSSSANNRYEKLSKNDKLITQLEKEKKSASGFLGFGQDQAKIDRTEKALQNARSFRNKELKGSNARWYQTYEAANTIPFMDRLVGGRNTLEENFFGADSNFPFTPSFAKIDDNFRRSRLGIEPVDFETFAYGLASKVIPGLSAAIGGGLGLTAGTLGGLITGPGAVVTGGLGTLGGAYIGDAIGQSINQYIWDNWTPASLKKNIQDKIQQYPESYSGGQWVGFAAEIAGGSAADDVIRKGTQAAVRGLSSKAGNFVTTRGANAVLRTSPSVIPTEEIATKTLGLFDDAPSKIANQSKRGGKTGGKKAPISETDTIIRFTDSVKSYISKLQSEKGAALASSFNKIGADNLMQNVRNAFGIIGIDPKDFYLAMPESLRVSPTLKDARGYYAANKGAYAGLGEIAIRNDVAAKTLYHEMVHSLFDGVRKKGGDAWERYQAKVMQIFGGDDPNQLTKAIAELSDSYKAPDIVYGKYYKLKYLDELTRGTSNADTKYKILSMYPELDNFFKNPMNTRNIPYDANFDRIVGGALEVAGRPDLLKTANNYGMEEFLTKLVDSANLMSNQQRLGLGNLLDDLLSGPPPTLRDNSVLASLNTPTQWEVMKQTWTRITKPLRRTPKTPVATSTPTTPTGGATPPTGLPKPPSGAPKPPSGAPKPPMPPAPKKPPSGVSLSDWLKSKLPSGEDAAKWLKGGDTVWGSARTWGRRTLGALSTGVTIDYLTGGAVSNRAQSLWEWLTGNSEGTIPDVGSDNRTTGGPLPPVTFGDDPIADIKYAADLAKRNFEVTMAGRAEAFTSQDGKYAFGQVVSATKSLGLKDPMGMVDFRVRSATIPEYEAGSNAPGTLLSNEDRQKKEAELQKLDNDLKTISDYDILNNPQTKEQVKLRDQLRRDLQSDYRAQINLGVPTGEDGKPPRFNLPAPRIPRPEDFGLTLDSTFGDTGLAIFDRNGRPVMDVVSQAMNTKALKDYTTLEQQLAILGSSTSATTGRGKTNGDSLNQYKADFEKVQTDAAGATILNGSAILGRFNNLKASYIKDFGPVDGLDDQAIPFNGSAVSVANAQGELIKQHLTGKLSDTTFIKQPFGGSGAGVSKEDQDKARTAIKNMMTAYGLSAEDDNFEASKATLVDKLRTASSAERNVINADQAWNSFDNLAKNYNSQLDKYWVIRARYDNREELSKDPLMRMTGSPAMSAADRDAKLQEIRKIDDELKQMQLKNDPQLTKEAVESKIAEKQGILDELYRGQDVKFEPVSSIDYLLFNTPLDTTSINPFKVFRDSDFVYGKPNTKNIADAGVFANSTTQMISELLSSYGRAFGITEPVPQNNDEFNKWIKGINPEKATSLPTVPLKQSWKLDKLENMYKQSGGVADDVTENWAAKFGLWSFDGVDNGFNTNFVNEYKQAFLDKAYSYLDAKSKSVSQEQVRLPKTTANYTKAIDALFDYTSRMDRSIYRKVNPGFGPLNISSVVQGKTDEEKADKLLQNIGSAYIDWKRPNIDKAFAGIPSGDIEGWRRIDNAYNFPQSPEEVRNTVLADVNTLEKLRKLDTYAINAVANGAGPADIQQLSGAGNLLAAGNVAMGDASVRGLMDTEGRPLSGDTKLVDFLVNAMKFETPSLVEDRKARFQTVIDKDLKSQLKDQSYAKYETELDNNLKRLIDAYTLWDSLKSYSISPESNIPEITTIDPASGQLVKTTGGVGKTIRIAGKDIAADSSFVSSYVSAFNEFRDPYDKVRTSIGYLSGYNNVNDIITPFNNPAEIMKMKMVDLQSTQNKAVGASDATAPQSASGSSLADDIKTKIREAHQMVQAKAVSIFGDNALQKSEADEYGPLLDNLGRLLSSNVPDFNNRSTPENQSWTNYRKHYGSIKRFGDMALDMNEVNANIEQIKQERALRAQLNQIIEPKYLSTGGQALVNYQPKGTDTVPAMLTRGEFVVNKQATSKHLPLLNAINKGSSAKSISGISYAQTGGIINPAYRSTGGVMGAVQSVSKMMGVDLTGVSSVFNNFIKSFNTETNNFGSLINNLARVFPALGGPVGAFGNHVDRLIKALDGMKDIEIKGPNIPDTIRINSDTIRVELIAPQDTNYKLSEEDKKKISDSVALQLKTLTTMGRIA